MHSAVLPRPLRVSTVVLLLVLALSVLTAPPALAGPWFTADFEDGVPDELADGWGWDPTSAGHAGAGLRTRMPAGQHWGASGHVDMSEIGAGTVDELYWRYWVRLAPDFYVEPPNRGKLPGPAGLYSYNCLGGRTSTPDEPCWSARTIFSRDYRSTGDPLYPDGPEGVTRLGSYVYHLDGPSNRGDIVMWDKPAALLDHGQWYCVEGRVRMNTPGAADGVLQNWVDGKQALDRGDLRFRRSSESQINVKSFWMDVYHGGGPSAADNDVQVDSLVLAPQRIGCDAAQRFRGTFQDDDGSVHEADIEWLAATGITRGCNPPANDRFCPRSSVTRGEMAAFLVRALDLPRAPGDRFTDDDTSMFAAAIESLAASGVTRGCNPPANDRFCPDDPVTRAQMAAFLTRAWDLPVGTTDFVDARGTLFAADVGALAGAGVTKGCNPPANDHFCPEDPVTRAQMATFVRRAAAK